VKPKLLFLVRVLLCSLGLFVIWHPISQGYLFLLKRIVALVNLSYALVDNGDLIFSKMSLYMIPFLSVIIITPHMPMLRRAWITGIGVLGAFGLDIIFIQYVISIKKPANIESQAIDVLFQCLKLVLPLLLWMIASPLRLFDPRIDDQAGKP
jgi:hypothetical protein